MLIKSFLFGIEFHKLLTRFRGNHWIGGSISYKEMLESDFLYQIKLRMLESIKYVLRLSVMGVSEFD